jgi:hypothetical protein
LLDALVKLGIDLGVSFLVGGNPAHLMAIKTRIENQFGPLSRFDLDGISSDVRLQFENIVFLYIREQVGWMNALGTGNAS